MTGLSSDKIIESMVVSENTVSADARFSERIIAHGLPKDPPKTITDPEELRRELTRVRAQGYAYWQVQFREGEGDDWKNFPEGTATQSEALVRRGGLTRVPVRDVQTLAVP